MSFSELATIINSGIGIIGIVVGIIGWRSLKFATKIRNDVKNVNNSTVQQAHTLTVNNGLDSYAVIKLSKETTKEELINIVELINSTELKISSVEEKIDNQPKIHTGSAQPKESKNGDIWFKTED
jgi:hypothetical protein